VLAPMWRNSLKKFEDEHGQTMSSAGLPVNPSICTQTWKGKVHKSHKSLLCPFVCFQHQFGAIKGSSRFTVHLETKGFSLGSPIAR
jgi:hypothetical protein